ncbi:uncharacterized protein C5orf34 homolog isoform X2 [Gigantopelta aegis]|nr:uncharacterized protein C5orf34 homolog isoform X2 [Gigantopelta aegis]
MMEAVPVLMVIYTSDAVEVRYSDGSRLELSPCGSVIKHHKKQDDHVHPISGPRFIQQRTRFVTSEYWNKVLHAVDFRNRFAEMPYVCQELLHEDKVVSLYADIVQAAWPRDAEKASIEHLPDGGVRIFSLNEYASLVLSPHKQEFTVCYLSKLGQESPRISKHSTSRLSTSCCSNSSAENNSCTSQEKHSHDKTVETNNRVTPEKHSNNQTQASTRHMVPENTSIENNSPVISGKLSHTNSMECNGHTRPEVCSDVNRSFTDDEKLRASPSNGRVDTVCTACRVSTPTDELDVGVAPHDKAAGFRCRDLDQIPVHDLSSISRTSSEGLCTTVDIDTTLDAPSSSMQNPDHTCGGSGVDKKPGSPRENVSTGNDGLQNKSGKRNRVSFGDLSAGSVEDNTIQRSPPDHSSTETIETNCSLRSRGHNSGSEVDGGDGSKCRHSYCWVTRHFSCNQCPLSWKHPLMLATEAASKKAEIGESSSPDHAPVVESSRPKKMPIHIDKKKCMLTSLPRALPLTCPFQHKHKWNIADDSEIIQAGILKVILIDGAVYRIIRMAAMNVIEVFPGDGSVFISQGISGQYFSYITYNAPQVIEKTFSLKALPPSLPGAGYSIEKLLKRASRFLSQASQSDKMSSTVDPCWKKEEVKIVEPLPVQTLEECHIPGWGKFTAHTNGRVRIVFEDRTSMDLVCDFSKRIAECVCHSNQSEELLQKCEAAKHKEQRSVTGLDGVLDRNKCRILLPSGKYVLVDLQKPGLYHKYVSQALE